MYPFASNISGKHALVTGGSKGIGRLIVQAFLAEGVNVSYCARSIRGDEFSKFQQTADGAKAAPSSVDISKPSDIKNWVKTSAEEFGRIDFIVANASPLLQEPTVENWEKSFQADVMGLVTLLEEALPYLKESAEAGSSPAVVVVTSMAGFDAVLPHIGSPYTAFSRAKAVICQDYARKLAPMGIRINSIALGLVETPSITHSDGSIEHSSYQLFKQHSPDILQGVLDKVPMKRAAQSEEVANTVVFLASSLAGYICGTTIVMDGSFSTAL